MLKLFVRRLGFVSLAVRISAWPVVIWALSHEGHEDKEFQDFQRAMFRLCDEQGYRHCDEISLSQIQQMLMEFQGKEKPYTSPETARQTSASNNSGLEASEASRSLRRFNHWKNLLEGEYEAFIRNQPEDDTLSRESFEALQAITLAVSSEERVAVEATAFLKPSHQAHKLYKQAGYALPKDSELLLTEVTRLANQQVSFMPAIDELPESSKSLLIDAYPEEFHVRHVMLCEAGLKRVRDATKSVQDNPQALKMAFLRWVVDLSGFNPTGLTESLYQRLQLVFRELQAVAEGKQPPESVMLNFLNGITESVPGLVERMEKQSCHANERLLIGRLIGFNTRITNELAHQILDGYFAFRKAYPERAIELAANYQTFLTSAEYEAPTYTPAVEMTARQEFEALELEPELAASVGAEYACHILLTLHETLTPGQRIACRDAAWKGNWQQGSWASAFFQGAGVRWEIKEGEILTQSCEANEEGCVRSAMRPMTER